MSAADIRAVNALIDTFGDALYARDADASMAVLVTDADLAVIPSEGVDVYRGPRAVRAFLDRIYSGPRRYGWRWKERWVALNGQTATIVALGTESVDEGASHRLIPYCLTGVAINTPTGWRLKLLHASEDSTGATS